MGRRLVVEGCCSRGCVVKRCCQSVSGSVDGVSGREARGLRCSVPGWVWSAKESAQRKGREWLMPCTK